MTTAAPDSQPVATDQKPPRPSRWNTGVTLIVAALVVIAAVWLFTRFNDFPFYYHPDEPRKAEQVLEKWRNFHHPLFMLMVTDRAAKLLEETAGFGRTNLQNLAVLGRWFSAIFSALAIGALCVVAGRRGWWPAAVLVGLVLLVNHDLFRFAHYFKEDTALVLGWALVLLAAQLLGEKVTMGRLIFAGIAAALCASAKYVGILLLPLLLLFLAIHLRRPGPGEGKPGRPFSAWQALGVVALAFLVAALLINWRFIKEFESFFSGFSREFAGVTEGHRGVRPEESGRFNSFYLQLLRGATPWVVWILAAAYFCVPLWQKTRVGGRVLFDGLLLSSIFIYLALISSTPKLSDRYLLPIVVLLQFLAAAGAGELLRLAVTAHLQLPRFGRVVLAALALVLPALLITHNITELRPIYNGFRQSSMAELIEWVNAGNLPEDAVILQTRRYLPDADIQFFRDLEEPIPQEVMEVDKIAETGSLEAALNAGATHILVSQGAYKRFLVFDPEKLAGDPEALSAFARQAEFYSQMTEQGRLIWDHAMQMPVPLHPGLELWELPTPP